MGKGDKKTKKGKIFKGSYGVSRPRKTETNFNIPTKKEEAPKKIVKSKKKVATKKKKSTKK